MAISWSRPWKSWRLTREIAVRLGAYANSGRKLAGVGMVVGDGVEVEVTSTTAVVVTMSVSVLADGVTTTTLRVVYVYSR